MSHFALRSALALACLLAGHGIAVSNEAVTVTDDCVDGNCPGVVHHGHHLGHHHHGHHHGLFGHHPYLGHDGYHGFTLGPANWGRVGGNGWAPCYGAACGGYGYGYLGYEGYNAANYEQDFRYYHAYAGPSGCRTCSAGDCQYRWYGRPDLFYNYYVPPTCGGVGAELYISPRPIPPHVGHTFITYQPLMPHEFLYHHKRTYHRYYNSGQGLTRTSVKYCR